MSAAGENTTNAETTITVDLCAGQNRGATLGLLEGALAVLEGFDSEAAEQFPLAGLVELRRRCQHVVADVEAAMALVLKSELDAAERGRERR